MSISKKTSGKKMIEWTSQRDSIVLPIIHVQKEKGMLSSLMGSDTESHINRQTVDRVKELLNQTDKKNIDIIVDTPGGDVSSVKQICDSIITFKEINTNCKVTVYIPYKAFSGGTILMLLADELHMGYYAHISPIDPQLGSVLGQFSGNDLNELIKMKGADTSDLGIVANSTVTRANDMTSRLFSKCIESSKKFNDDEIKNKLKRLLDGGYLHSEPISVKDCAEFGVVPDHLMSKDDIKNLQDIFT